jgi:hypothetical protein
LKEETVMIDIEADLMGHLTRLCDHIGTRLIGTPPHQAAADYIEQTFQSAGLVVRQQPFDCPAWRLNRIELTIDGEPLTALANTFSPACDLTAPTLAVGTLAELEAADFQGRMGVLYGELTTSPLANQTNSVYLPEQHERIIRLLQQKQPPALITIAPDLADPVPIIEDWAFLIPSATISATDGQCLLRRSSRPLRLKVDSTMTTGRACNIIAQTANQAPARLVLMAHFDTKATTTGALDNGSGSAVLLTLANLLGRQPLPVELEFVAFGGEEYGLGSDVYLANYGLATIRFGQPDQSAGGLNNVIAAINIDGVGQFVGVNSVMIAAASLALTALVAEVKDRYPGLLRVDPWPASNHYDFYTHSVPTLAFSSIGAANLIHRPLDNLARISPARLVEVVSFIVDLIGQIQDKSPAWSTIQR